jgi:hypothetical protein
VVYWPDVEASYGELTNTKPLYKAFREVIRTDLRSSQRLGARGLTKLLCDIVQYCFQGDMFSPPVCIQSELSMLVANDSALVLLR